MIKSCRLCLLIAAFFAVCPLLRAQDFAASATLVAVPHPNDSTMQWDKYLDEFVVTATRTPKALSSAPILTRVIGDVEIQSSSFENMTELLEYNIPGLSFKKDGRGINMQVQGLENSYILVLVDGERLAKTPGGNIDLSRISQQNIKQIEVVKGASSVLYGSNAIGMVVNIITRRPERKLEGSSSYRYGKYSSHIADLNIGGKLGDWSGRTSAYYYGTDGYNLLPENLQVYTINPHKDYNIEQKIWWKKGRAKLFGSVSYFRQDQYNPPLSIREDRYRNSNFSYNLKGEYVIGGHELSLSYFADLYQRNTIIGDKALPADTKFHQHTIRLMDHVKPTDPLEIIGGAELNINKDFSNIQFGDNKKTRKVHDVNLFAQGDWQILPELNLTGGARYTSHSAFGSAFTPKINLMYAPWSRFKLRAGYSMGFKAPNSTELFSDFMMGSVSHNIGNPDLKAERSQYGYFSAEYRTHKLAVSGEVYQNSLRDKIQSSFVRVSNGKGEEWTELRYSNIGRVRIRGFEMNADLYPLSWLALRANYAYTDAVNMDNKLQLQGNARHSAGGVLSFRGEVLTIPSALTISGRWVSPKIYDQERKSINSSTGKEERTIEARRQRAYSLWRATGQVTPWEKGDMRVTLSLGVQNIFDFTDPEGLTTFEAGRRFFGKVEFNF